ncbi:MAG: Do family serine endopeptidase [Terriglobales bacterium]
MNANNRSVFQRMAHSPRLYAVGVAVLVSAALASAAFMRMPLLGHASDSPVVATAAPVPESTIAPLLALDRANEAISERILPSVVNIQVEGKNTAVTQTMPGSDQIPAPFRQFFFQGPQTQPRSEPFVAWGTGVIISPDGYIVTNNHVVNDATHVQVTLNDRRAFDAKVVGTDKATDLAVVKIDATGLTSAAFGDSSQLKPGDTVLAFGDPLGMDFSVTRGIVSALNRSRSGSDGRNSRGSFIQTDAPINHGNSGGPLVNARGEVIGINTEMLSTSGASIGIGFAIPSNLVKPTAESLIKSGKVVRGYLGITVADLTPSVADSLNESGARGALISQVNDGSPAAAAGLKPYDVITGFDGHKISTGTELQTMAGGTAPGTTAHLEVMRNAKPLQVAVTLGNYDNATSTPTVASASESGTSASGAKLGVSVAPLTDDVRGQLQLPDSVHGVVVQAVTPGGAGMIAGLQQGDVIEQVNQHAVNTVEELRHQLSLAPAGKDILLMVHNTNGDFIVPIHSQQ